jgi:hypothetical protein
MERFQRLGGYSCAGEPPQSGRSCSGGRVGAGGRCGNRRPHRPHDESPYQPPRCNPSQWRGWAEPRSPPGGQSGTLVPCAGGDQMVGFESRVRCAMPDATPCRGSPTATPRHRPTRPHGLGRHPEKAEYAGLPPTAQAKLDRCRQHLQDGPYQDLPRPTEAVNLLIHKVKRVGHGFRNSPTIGCGCSCTAPSGGRLTAPHSCDADPHPGCRSAANRAATRSRHGWGPRS